ncbi:MAG: hypothetical protein Q7S32_01095, partial [bacterium]|nr:hypothetical protein [bacterium]
PSKKISLQKIFGSNLTLKKRGAFGIAQNHWLSLANAKEKISKTDLTLILVPIGELNWNGILRNIREIKDLLTIVLPEAGIIPDFSTLYA